MHGFPYLSPDFYEQCLVTLDSPLLRDAPAHPFDVPRWNERHLQCVWYDERLRPSHLQTESGEPVVVLSPGRWNLGAGPDFLGASLRIGDRCVTGDVEVHIRPSDWRAHGHGSDPRYADVAVHVTYHPLAGDAAGVGLPPHIVSVSLRAPLAARRGFALEDIDIAAYPHEVLPATPRPCGVALSRLSQDAWADLLSQAGRHRIRVKAARIRARLDIAGNPRQVFYEECMAMLGAKSNTTPFRKVAQMLPLDQWDRAPGPEADFRRYARLLGTAGLLPDPDALRHAESRDFAAALRAEWFRTGGGAESIRDCAEWNFSGLRPANRPERRLAAAAVLFADDELLDRLLAHDVPDRQWFSSRLNLLVRLRPLRFWASRPALDSDPGPRPLAPLGAARAAVLLSNVLIPLRLAEEPDAADALLPCLPPEDLAAPARETAFRLFGRDHNPALYLRSGLREQGLLAIHRDFCLRVQGGCEACPLAAHLSADDPGALRDRPPWHTP